MEHARASSITHGRHARRMLKSTSHASSLLHSEALWAAWHGAMRDSMLPRSRVSSTARRCSCLSLVTCHGARQALIGCTVGCGSDSLRYTEVSRDPNFIWEVDEQLDQVRTAACLCSSLQGARLSTVESAECQWRWCLGICNIALTRMGCGFIVLVSCEVPVLLPACPTLFLYHKHRDMAMGACSSQGSCLCQHVHKSSSSVHVSKKLDLGHVHRRQTFEPLQQHRQCCSMLRCADHEVLINML